MTTNTAGLLAIAHAEALFTSSRSAYSHLDDTDVAAQAR